MRGGRIIGGLGGERVWEVLPIMVLILDKIHQKIQNCLLERMKRR
jgi:hypothetical protein